MKWLDAGISGGIWGYDIGYCTMTGGGSDAFEQVEPAFRTLAPPGGGPPGRLALQRAPGAGG